MGSSWKICRVAGIPIYVHWTFFILIAFVIYGHWSEGQSLAATAEGVGFILALFGCVVLHELGHAVTAQQFGVPTTDITLLPIGGVARLQRIPENPAQELAIALAGPLVNIVIAGGLWLGGIRLPASPQDPQHLVQAQFLPKLLELNLFLALFNLLPAFPMDGGRVLRALLALRLEYGRATRVAATVGQFVAILFAFVGLQGNLMLLLIALFVWVGAASEAAQVQERIALRNIPVRQAMLTEYSSLAPEDTLGHAAELLLAGSQHDFPVVSDGHALGVLARADLLSGLAQAGREARVAEFQRPQLGTIEADSPIVPAMNRLRENNEPCLQVVEDGRPVGLLTLENIGEYLMVRSALEAHDHH